MNIFIGENNLKDYLALKIIIENGVNVINKKYIFIGIKNFIINYQNV